MKEYQSMTKQELQEEYEAVLAQYQSYQAKGLKLDMSRGKPCAEQLELSNELLSQPESVHWGKWRGFPQLWPAGRYAPGPPFLCRADGCGGK